MPENASGGSSSSSSLLIRSKNPRRCQAENPLKLLSEFAGPALGVEYALTNQWTTFAEYNHIGVPSTIVPFPTVGEINSKTIKMKQSVDVFKLGVNYKFCLHLDEDR
ncbi:outer membrane protein [Bradyrhizobium diazoefficiens]|uniref:outer membrane protein n=1 Tax=Bradyrhizobium diazoefficiens TaxID=1355477 RepID=UPI00384BB640